VLQDASGAGIGSSVVDLATQQVTWPAEVFRMLGLDPSVTKPGLDAFVAAIHSDDRAMMRDVYSRGRKGEETSPVEFRVVSPDGKIRWFNSRAVFDRDVDGQPISLTSSYSDVTDRKASEASSRRNRDHLAWFQSVAKIGASEVNLITEEETWSDDLYRFLDLDPRITKPGPNALAASIHPDDRAIVHAQYSVKGRRAEEQAPCEFRIIGSDGAIRWLYRKANFVRDAHGNPTKLIANLYDITEHKAAEDALRSSQKHLARAQQLGRLGSVEVDLRTNQVYWSPEIYRLHGLDPATVGVPNLDLVVQATHPDDRPAVLKFIETARGRVLPPPMENRILLHDGEVRWIRRTAEFVTDDRGVPVTLLIINQDITERKQNEIQIERERDTAQRYLDVAGVMILVLAPDETVTQINRKGCAILGYDDPKEIIGKSWIDRFIPDREREETRDGFRRLLDGTDHSMRTHENSVVTKSGQERIIAWQNAVVTGDGLAVATLSSGEDITERKSAEAALRTSEIRYRRLFEAAKDGILILDAVTGRIVDINPFLVELLGFDYQHYIGKELADIGLFKDREASQLAFKELQENRYIRYENLPLRAADGGSRQVEFVSNTYLAGANDVIQCNIRDITERKRTEEALERSREHLVRVQNVAKIGSIEVDLATQELFWSEETLRLLGVAPNSVPIDLETAIAMVHPDDRARYRDASERGRRGEETEPGEFRVIGKDGSLRWFDRRADFVRNAEGVPTKLIATFQDITDRKNADFALHRSREHLARVQRIAKIGSTEIDIATHEEYWSDEMYRFIGLDAKSAKFDVEAFLESMSADDRIKLHDARERGEKGEEVGPAEYRMADASGAVHWILRQATVDRDDAGRPTRMIATWHDITDRKAAEDALLRGREHLARAQRLGHIGSIEVDLHTDTSYWSDEVYRLYDLDPGSAGPPGLDLVLKHTHPDDRQAVIAFNRALLSGSVPAPMENRIPLRDGSVRWIQRTAEIVNDESGVPAKLLITNQDITERKSADEVMRRGREHLALVQRVAMIGSIEVDLVTHETLWSDELFHFLGLDPKSTAPQPDAFWAVLDPDARAMVRERIVKGLRGEETEPCEFRVIGPGTTIRWFYRNAEILRDASGRPTKLLSIMYEVTARKSAEETLRRSREHLARVQMVARIGSIEVDLITQKPIWSEEMYRLLGIDPNIADPGIDAYLAAVHPDDRAKVRELSARGRRGEYVQPCEYRIVGPNGAIRWMYHQAVILRDGGGRPTRHIMTMYDITDRKAAEEVLRLSREHLALVQCVAKIGSTEVDLITKEATWSDEMYEFLHLDPKTTKPGPDTFAAAVHRDDRAMILDQSVRGRAGETLPPCEYRVVEPDGTIRWYYRNTKFIRDPDGRPTKLIATMYDITKRKFAEEASRASDKKYQLTFDLAPIGIAHVALDGRFLLVNRTLCTMLGFSREEILKRDFQSFTFPEDLTRSNEAVARLLSGEVSVISSEKRYVRVDQKILWCSITSTIERAEVGRAANFISTYEDITPRKDAQARQLQLEEQLQQSQKMEAVGRLTGGVAHDFNNLLTVMLINLELIGERVVGDPRLKRQIEAALGAGRRGADLTQRLLAFSRRQPLAPAVIDINKRIIDLVPLLTRTLGDAIAIKQVLGSSLWMAEVDPSQFENAIMNLAVNAHDATPAGGILEIKTENVWVDDVYAALLPGLATGRYVRISVTDTGTGMPPEVVAKAFEPFYTTKEVGKGTGLGLSMTYGFIKQSGGHISIYSEVGRGTTITMLLPAIEKGPADEVIPVATRVPQRIASETILVVEDDPDVRLAAVTILDALGYRTLEAGTVREGFTLFAANPAIDLVLTDVILPGGEDGADLGRRARALRPGTKILFMSGYTEDIVMHNGRLDAGVVLLQKPFTRNQLAEKVRAAIDDIPPATAR
jgi:PAS domain S-box-containing protein